MNPKSKSYLVSIAIFLVIAVISIVRHNYEYAGFCGIMIVISIIALLVSLIKAKKNAKKE